jgi:hypothetical protein
MPPARQNGSGAVARERETSKVSLARKLERNQGLAGRAAHWLLIKGGAVVVVFLGLFLLSLLGIVQGGR